MFSISVLFTIIFIIFYLVLTVFTIKIRKSTRIAYGDGNNKKLIRAIRAHGNFFEFTVFFIISSFLLEALDGDSIYLLIVNIIFVLGRVSHAYSMFKEKIKFRAIGMMATLLTYTLNSAYLLYLYFR
jgi:uncharacterized membrane protein YecN with MAPEG domain